VFVPSPQGDLRVVIRRTFVGSRTGPLTFKFSFRAASIKAEQTDSKFWTLRLVRVILIRWKGTSSVPTAGFLVGGGAVV